MKKILATMLVASMAVAGCQSNKSGDIQPSHAPTSTPSKTQTAKPSQPSTPSTTKTVEPEPTKETPEPAPQTTPPPQQETPATQFALRWGVKYPLVPEYAILKAAKGTCLLIEQGGVDWFSDPVIMGGIEEVVTSFGLDKKDALEFAQDADQNYCSSIVNPV